MKRVGMAFILVTAALAAAPVPAQAQGQIPTALATRARNLLAICQAEGGQAMNGDRAFVYSQYDLTGDGRPDFVMDEAGFGCTNRNVLPIGPNGARVEVYDGVSGASLFAAEAYRVSFIAGRRPLMVLTLRGTICGPTAGLETECQRPMTWSAAQRGFTGMPSAQAISEAMARSQALQQSAATVAKPQAAAAGPIPPGPPAGQGALALSDADKVAAMRAAGFKAQGGRWKRCDDPETTSYSPGAIEHVVDLNADGRPEVVITEGGTYCFGNTGQGTVIVSKGAAGAWTVVLDATGIFVPMKTWANGWLEVEIGGPGFTQPVYRFNGKTYVHHRTIQE